MRIQIIRNIILILFILISLDLFYLQVIRGGHFARLSQSNSLRLVPDDGPRGGIFDRNGKVLAESVKGYDVAIIPQDTKNKKAILNFIAVVLGVEQSVLERRFEKNKMTPFSPVTVAERVTRPQAITLAESMLIYPGLVVTEHFRRQYPRNEAAAHLVGYVGKVAPDKMQELANNGYNVPDLVGYTGVEEAYDDRLRGESGGREIEVNSRGREVRVLSVREPSAGAEIVLTVDARIQTIAYDVIGGRRGAFVMLDPPTGEVLSLVSSPAFDPNVFSSPDRRNRVGEILSDARAPMVNRAFGAAFPPGSAFKIPVAFAGLEERKILTSTTFNCPGYFELGGRRYEFAHAYGPQNFLEAMAHSANEYFFNTGLLLGRDVMADYARRFGLGERTGIDLPYEVKGNIPGRTFQHRWYKGDTLNMSIGQGYVTATPLQLARMMATIENGGRLVTPHVVLSVGERSGSTFQLDNGTREIAERSSRISLQGPLDRGGLTVHTSNVNRPSSARLITFRPDVWDAIRQSLSAVVKLSSGTGSALDIPGLEIYGKTGTAQSGEGKSDHAWFAGVVRSPKRTAAFCVFLDQGGSSHNAVLAAKEIIQRLKDEGVI